MLRKANQSLLSHQKPNTYQWRLKILNSQDHGSIYLLRPLQQKHRQPQYGF